METLPLVSIRKSNNYPNPKVMQKLYAGSNEGSKNVFRKIVAIAKGYKCTTASASLFIGYWFDLLTSRMSTTNGKVRRRSETINV